MGFQILVQIGMKMGFIDFGMWWDEYLGRDFRYGMAEFTGTRFVKFPSQNSVLYN